MSNGASEQPEQDLPNDESMALDRSDYSGDDLKHLSDLEHVRERPSMYIGDTTLKGLHHLVYEVVDNSIDEAMAGHAKTVSVTINADGSVTVEDDGRGIPTDRHAQLSEMLQREVSTLEGVMTVLKFGGKFEKKAYQTSGGLHGVGVTVVNFLSQWCEVEVSRNGQVWMQTYERGVPTSPAKQVRTTSRRGTKTTFKPDSQIFPNTKFNYDTLHKRLQELAFLNSGVRIRLRDERQGQGDEFYYERGIVEFVEHLNRASDVLHEDVILIEGKRDDVGYSIAFQYSGEYTENLQSYVNNIHTIEGGTHVSGFRSALTRTLNAYGKKENLFKDLTPTGDDFREGLTAVISMRVGHPQFEGQTKTKLGNGEIEGITVLGGEPSEQPEGLADLLSRVRTDLRLTTMVYSGRTHEELIERADARPWLAHTDLLVDGPFLESEYDESVPWRGSRNQRLIPLSTAYTHDTLAAAAAAQGKAWSVRVDEEGRIRMSGLQETATTGTMLRELARRRLRDPR